MTQRVTVPHVPLALENHAHRLLSDARFRVRLRVRWPGGSSRIVGLGGPFALASARGRPGLPPDRAASVASTRVLRR